MRTFKKSRAVGAGAAVVVVVLAIAWLAPISSANPGNTQITVFDVEGPYEKTIDVGKPGFSAGDQTLEIQPLIEPDDGSSVGQALTRFEILRSVHKGEDFDFVIDCTISLADGDIVFYGAGRFSDVFAGITLPVTGGTGTYALARGTVTLTAAEVQGKEGALLAFDLTTA